MKKLLLLFYLSMISIHGFSQWIQQPSNTTNMLRSICFTDANTGYVVGRTGTILKTTDGGTSWNALNIGTTHTLYSICFTSPDTAYFVGGGSYLGDGIIFKTTDAGDNWTLLSYSGGYALYSVFFTEITRDTQSVVFFHQELARQ